MSETNYYPQSPNDTPVGLNQANSKYKKQAWLAMTGLLAFILLYLALAATFGYIAYINLLSIQSGGGLAAIAIMIISTLLTIFMVKSLFTVRKSASPHGIEVTTKEEFHLRKT